MDNYLTGKECKRCHRTDLPIVSNRLCIRCDNYLFQNKRKELEEIEQ